MQEKRLHRRNPIFQTIWDNWFYILVMIFLWRFPFIVADWTNSDAMPASPRIASESKFWQGIMIEVFILALLALSYNLMFGYAGIISFGHGIFFGSGAYTVVILVDRFQMTLLRSVLVALCVGIIFGLIWSMAAFRLRGVYFAMFSLAFAQIFFELSRLTLFTHLTHGDDGLTWTVPEWISPIRNRLMLYNIALIILIFAFLWVRRLMNSPSGKVLLAIRENEKRAETLGYNIYLYKTMAIVTSAILATTAGILHAILNRQVAPGVLSIDRTVDPLLMTLIGGTGSIPGPYVGAVLLRVGQEFIKKPDLWVHFPYILGSYTTTINSEKYWGLVLGLAFIFFVMAVPYGVVGSLQKLWFDIRRWLRRYTYNPLVRRYPSVAVWGEYFTGEPPEFARMVASQPNELSLGQWMRAYPHQTLNTLVAVPSILLGLLTLDWRVGVEWFLFLGLISLGVRIVLQVEKIVRNFRKSA